MKGLLVAVLAAVTRQGFAVPDVHDSVYREINKGEDAVIMVTFESASVDLANDPMAMLNLQRKSSNRAFLKTTLPDYINQDLYHDFRGHYVFSQIQEQHMKTRQLLQKILPRGAILQSIPISNSFLIKGTQYNYETLRKRDDVVEINTNKKFDIKLPESGGEGRSMMAKLKGDRKAQTVIQWNIQKVGAPSIWALNNTRSKGKGIIYGVADTGMDFKHPNIKANYLGLKSDGTYEHNYAWFDGVREHVEGAGKSSCSPSSHEPCDDQGHGTHVTSIAVGADGYGVAPDARWMGCRNMDAGVGSTSTYLNCLNFFLAPHDLDGNNPRPELRPHVVGNSYGCPASEGCSKHAMTAALTALRAAGVFLAVSAGNEGPSCGSIAMPPALEPSVVSVGATDRDDHLAAFSSRGPVTIDGLSYRKPDISAPGVGILAAYLRNDYRRLSGTSMASPHVSSAVALMLAMCPCLERDVDRIQAILESTTVILYPPTNPFGTFCGSDTATSHPNNYFGYGRLDIPRAVQTCMEFCSIRQEQPKQASVEDEEEEEDEEKVVVDQPEEEQ